MIPGIFLDRDGVIIEYRANYVRSWEDVEIYPQALRVLKRIRSLDRQIVIITNQSAVGRGLVSLQKANDINQRLLEEIHKAGGRIDGLYLCPHTPEEGCPCRKPKPGLILQAARDLDIDLKHSILIGDNLTDLQAGQAAGIARVALVRTGLGESLSAENFPASLAGVLSCKDLEDALCTLIPLETTGASQ